MLTGNTTTSANTSNAAISEVEHRAQPQLPARWTCNTCHASFMSSALQREHMKSQWHVYNLKRRVAELPPVDFEVFENQIQNVQGQTRTVSSKAGESHDQNEDEEFDTSPASSNYDEDPLETTACLFCNWQAILVRWRNEDGSYKDTIDKITSHMLSEHSFFIPDRERLLDMESFLGYLRQLIFKHNECLYCGTTRGTYAAIQQHMINAGHCMLNFEREPELLAFWEGFGTEEEESEDVMAALTDRFSSADMKQLGGRKAALSKSATAVELKKARKARRAVASKALITAEADATAASSTPNASASIGDSASTPSSPSLRQLARRTEQGMLGVTLHQRQALEITEKKAQHREQIRVKAEEWSRERIANKQKHYRAAGPMRPNG